MFSKIHKDVKELFEEYSSESVDTQTHCTLKKAPPVEESIEDSTGIHNDVKEVFEG